MRKLLVLGGALLVASCDCGKPVEPGSDAGVDAGTPCTVQSECAFGEDCVEGYCSLPVTPDAGVSCTRHEDCPTGQLCLPSTGQCFTPADTDAGDEDGGIITGECNPGDTQSCGSSKLGQCKLGLASCGIINGAYAYGTCVGNVEPVAELCNGLDDDCDGLIDDGFPDLSCGVGECKRTVPGCVNGVVSTCTAGSPSTEVCDNKDNNCDGQLDNMPDIVCGTGACQRSAGACDAGVPGTCVPGGPSSESCDRIDNDCNGAVDDGLATLTCGVGICFNSVYSCADGGTVACQPLTGTAENCNNFLDDNCNGFINEGCACTAGQTLNCYSGPNGTQNNLPCKYGTQSCIDGGWGACIGEVVPVTETCNTVDDNCNGTPDDLGSTTCGVGQCRRTVQNCVSGVTQTCVAGTPGTEVCNGLDDDCDGTNDNNIPNLTCGVGACFRSVPACLGTGNNTCVQGTTTTESCNGVDDDCDGTIDNNIPPASCSTGQAGPCNAGARVCTGGVSTCQRTYTPVPEICGNNLDDDCNGTKDIGAGCCDAGTDLDFDRYDQCSDCNDTNGAINPDAGEKCNGYDDNCNVLIDEGYDKDNDGFTVCGTLDGGGIDVRRADCNDDAGFVQPLKPTDCGNAATPTSANGVDDNCNGYIDETCACNPLTDRDSDGANECIDCNDRDNTVRPGIPEVCDGKDNDCNRATLDNCGVSQPCGFRSGSSYVPWPAGTDQCRPDLVCVSSVATNELTCGSYCNQTNGLGLNDSCSTNQVCNRILIDSDKLNLCSEYPSWTGITAVGGTCSVDTDCAKHTCRIDGAQKYCTDNCNHTASCPATTTCFVESTLTIDSPGMFTDYYAYVSRCRRDALIPGAVTQGNSCTSDAQCRSGACFQGKCASPCCAHSDCTGSACGLGPIQPIGYVSGTTKLFSAVPVCWNTVGTRPSGAACAANADCKSRICDALQGVCMDICCNDSSCSTPGQTCEPLPLVIPDGGVVDVVRGCVFSPIPSRIQMRPVP